MKQVRDVGLENKTDTQIWQYAKANGYAIVTLSTSRVVAALVMRKDLIESFLNDDEIGYLEIRS